jgi:hypothetical protein
MLVILKSSSSATVCKCKVTIALTVCAYVSYCGAAGTVL